MKIVKIKWAHGADTSLPLPAHETTGSSGVDLRANLIKEHRKSGLALKVNSRLLISTGLHIEIPRGYEAQIRPRSGLALKSGITLMNAVGTIDSDSRGVVGVMLYNAGERDFIILHGGRIAQMVISPVEETGFELVESLSQTDRDIGGFGSTGNS